MVPGEEFLDLTPGAQCIKEENCYIEPYQNQTLYSMNHPFPIPCPMRLFHLSVAELDPFIINWQGSK